MAAFCLVLSCSQHVHALKFQRHSSSFGIVPQLPWFLIEVLHDWLSILCIAGQSLVKPFVWAFLCCSAVCKLYEIRSNKYRHAKHSAAEGRKGQRPHAVGRSVRSPSSCDKLLLLLASIKSVIVNDRTGQDKENPCHYSEMSIVEVPAGPAWGYLN